MKTGSFVKHSVFFVILGFVFISANVISNSAVNTALQLTVEGDLTGSYNETQIKNELPTVTGWGGYQRTTGTIVPASKWKGIHLPLFLSSLIRDDDFNVSAIAIDDYSISMTRDEINGGIRAFDDENNTLVTTVIPILAYEENDAPISNDDGPLRLVFIGDNNESILTMSPRWVKQIVILHITTIVGETSSITITSTSTTAEPHTSDSTTTSEEENLTTNSDVSLSLPILVLVITTIIIKGFRNRKY